MINIDILGLFGYFDYSFSIEENNITILSGPNGYGKSTIIRCINAIGNSDLNFFFETIFNKIKIRVDRKCKELIIAAKEDCVEFNGKRISKRHILYFKRGIDPERINDLNEKTEFTQEKNDYKEILNTMKDIFGEVFFISEHRIVENQIRRYANYPDKKTRFEYIESTEDIPHRIMRHMQEAEGNYSQKANELDSTFPERLFNQKSGISERDFYENLSLMHERVQKLHNYGFTRMRELKNMEFRSEDSRALKIYFDDFNSKYQEFQSILDKLELFRDIVNRRFRFKRMEISNTRGIAVIDAASMRPIPLTRLSSGEKEIIVLFYNLLFENMDGGIVLIDEPETSLHIAWQRMFIEDLKKIAELRKLTVLIATHSPQIVSGNRNIQIDLGELYKNGLD